MFKEMLSSSGFWTYSGTFCDVVISSRLRLVRNHSEFSFPTKLHEFEKKQIKNIAKDFTSKSIYSENLNYIDLEEISDLDRRFLRERNYITSEIENKRSGLLIKEKNDAFSIIVNENDHFKVQVIRPGLELKDTYTYINKIDDELNKFVPYAYSTKYGYLTSTTNNVGTGLKVSTLLHLPILTIMKNIYEINNDLKNKNININPVTGNENKNFGSLYIIANDSSIGKSEDEIVDNINNSISSIIELEYSHRDNYLYEYARQLEDKIWRSYGILKYSRSMSYSEALKHLSNIRLGVVLSIIKNNNLFEINDLMVKVQSAHLQKISKLEKFSMALCDEYRASYLRTKLS